jgi:integrase
MQRRCKHCEESPYSRDHPSSDPPARTRRREDPPPLQRGAQGEGLLDGLSPGVDQFPPAGLPRFERGVELELCDGGRYYWPFFFSAMTGCRPGEMLGLRWRDIEWDRKDLTTGKVQTVAAIRQTVIALGKESGTGREGRIVARTKTDRPG